MLTAGSSCVGSGWASAFPGIQLQGEKNRCYHRKLLGRHRSMYSAVRGNSPRAERFKLSTTSFKLKCRL